MPPFEKDYFEMLKERAKKSHVYRKHQMIGLMLAEILRDDKHKALYIKLAKERDPEELLALARSTADRINVKNKGAYFMGMLFRKKSKSNVKTKKKKGK
jgi:hypothetical protein